MYAAYYGNKEALDKLIELGADCNVQDFVSILTLSKTTPCPI